MTQGNLVHNYPWAVVLDAAPDAMLVLDSAGRIRFVNARLERVFGYARTELAGLSFETLLRTRSSPRYGALLARFLALPGAALAGQRLDLVARHKCGRVFPVEVALSLVAHEGVMLIIASLRDVSARRQIQEQARMQGQLDTAPLTIVRVDMAGRITHVNAAWRRFARENGADAKTIRGVGLAYVAPPGVDGFAELLSSRRSSFEYVYPCHSATELRWFRLDARRVAADDAIVITHTNITDHHLAEQRLRLQALVAQALAESVPLHAACERLLAAACEGFEWGLGAVWMPDDAGRVVCRSIWTRPGFHRGFAEAVRADGLDPGRGLHGKAWASREAAWIEDLRSDADHPLQQAATRIGLRSGFAVPLSADGEVFAVLQFFGRIQRRPDTALLELFATSGAYLGGQVLRARAEARAADAEAARRTIVHASLESEKRFRQILDAIPDLVLLKGPGSRILWANAAFRRLHGLSDEPVEGLVDLPHNNPDYTKRYVQDDARVFETAQPLVVPEQLVKGVDGLERRFHAVKSPLLDEAGKVVMLVSVCHDITRRLQMESQLRLADRMASVGTLAAGVAHEINTPVQFVSDSVHFLRDSANDVFALLAKLEKLRHLVAKGVPMAVLQELAGAATAEAEDADLPYLRENVPKAFERCLDGLGRVATIVSSMKEFAHPAQRDMAPADLNRAIHNTLTIACSEYKFVADVETDLGDLPPVTCYVNEINQVLLNIVVNAAHAIAEVVKVSGRKGTLKVCSRLDGDHALVSIADTGPGIPEALSQRVFEMFFTTKEVGKGTGQGLALAWTVITDKHGGTLHFESRPGAGTTFFIRLPVAGVRTPTPS